MGKLLYSEPLVTEELAKIKKRINANNLTGENTPVLQIIRVGNDQASKKYVDNKIKMCGEVGITSQVTHFSEYTPKAKLLEYIYDVNKSNFIDACLIQLPLPLHPSDSDDVLNALHPSKDVDGFSEENLGKLISGKPSIQACTPKGVISLLKYYGIEIAGKNVVIINRSVIVGKPLSLLLLKEDATVTVCHSKTENLQEHIDKSDIVITAVGLAGVFTADNFRNSKCKTIVDISINMNEDGKLCGDIEKKDYYKILDMGISLTPVPGGIGPMTVLSLIKNTCEIKERSMKESKEDE